jgi:hypothetical protein
MCIVDEPCVLKAGGRGLKIGLHEDLELEPNHPNKMKSRRRKQTYVIWN